MPTPTDPLRDQRIHAVVTTLRDRLLAGEAVDAAAIEAANPDLMPELADELRKLLNIEAARSRAADPPSVSTSDVGSSESVAPNQAVAGAPALTCPQRSGPGVTGVVIPGFDVLAEIGRGGQAVVYKALQRTTRREVAIKVLVQGPFASTGDRRRFEREVELVAQFQHPHIVSVFEAGVTPDGRPYFVMDYVRGLSLRDYVRENHLSLERVLKLFVLICEAVQHAHQRGVIHRDLKPDNMRVDHAGNPKILDFGLARQLLSPADGESISAEVMGTLPYMSPEQTTPRSHAVDARSDVYSLGVILYELLTGHYPYAVIGSMEEVLRNIRTTPPASPSRAWNRRSGVHSETRRRRTEKCPIDNDVETIVLKALAKEPERRYQSAGELARDVQRFLDREPIDAKRDSFLYVLRKRAAQNLPLTVTAISVFGIILGCTFISGWFWSAANEARRSQVFAEAASAQQNAALSKLTRSPLPEQVAQMAFGWFLLEWHAGRRERAVEISQLLRGDSAERAAAEFLLDERQLFEQLETTVPRERRAVALFTSGERFLRAGRLVEAAKCFEKCRDAPGDLWIKQAAVARLQGPPISARRENVDLTDPATSAKVPVLKSREGSEP